MDWITRIFRKWVKPAEAGPGAMPERGFQSDHVYHSLPCRDRAGNSLEGSLGWTFGNDTHVTYRIPALGHDFFAKGLDVWEAFCGLRAQLERKGYLIQCAGARMTVRPSGMARSMGDGTTAYVHRMGESPDPETDTVYIFEPCNPGEGVSLAEQERHYQKWRDSFDDNDL